LATTRTSKRDTTTIRVSVAARDQLHLIAQEGRQTVGEVVDALIEAERRRTFWEEMRVAVERLKADPEAWADHQAEFRLWDSASADGLEEYADDEW